MGESWGKDTTVNGKQLSSLSFSVAECDRIGKPSCTASQVGGSTSKGTAESTPALTTPGASATNKSPTLSVAETTKVTAQPIAKSTGGATTSSLITFNSCLRY